MEKANVSLTEVVWSVLGSEFDPEDGVCIHFKGGESYQLKAQEVPDGVEVPRREEINFPGHRHRELVHLLELSLRDDGL